MPKIKPSSQRAPQSPPAELKEFIDLFITCPENELASHLARFTRWDKPRGDLHQWIAPLNRFDDILEKAVKNHGFRETLKIQRTAFPPELKECLCQIMRVTIMLFANCSYRSIYSSALYIYELLGTTDLDVLENALGLISYFAARTAQKMDNMTHTFVIPKARLWKFATGEAINSRQSPFPDLKSLLSNQVVIPPNWTGYHFHYYKRAPSSSVPSTSVPPRSVSNTQISPVTPSTRPRDATESSSRSIDSSTTSDNKPTEGWVRLYLNPDTIVEKGVEAVYRDLVTQANIPKDDQYRLFVQIMMAYYYSSAIRRQQFVRCQIHAISALASVVDSHSLEKQLYNARPELLQQIVRLLHNDSEADIALKTIVLKTIRTLSRSSAFAANRRNEQSRYHQILNALDSNLNHGILMTMLRENITLLQSSDPTTEEMEYTLALHRLVKEVLDSPQGASNLGFAGAIPLLVEVMGLERPSIWKIAAATADVVTSLLLQNRYLHLLPLLTDAGGLGTVIRVVKRHVDYNISLQPKPEELSFPEQNSINSFLALLLRILRAGHGERVRNVVDSEVIGSLREILNNITLFGGPIGYATTKLVATIIHNEPTSYAALHESGLPQAFLGMVRGTIPAYDGLLSAIPNVFDAICINTQGKELFSKDDFEGFFRVFKSLDHCKALTRGHCASDCGAQMDELLRHHPDLKDSFMQCFIGMTKELCLQVIPHQIPSGSKLPKFVVEEASPGPNTTFFSSVSGEELTGRRVEDEKSPTILLTRSLVSFAEGFFSTAHWVKDFLKEDGHLMLLGIIEAPGIPYDFAESKEHYTLRSLMLQFADQHGGIILPPLIECTRKTIKEIARFSDSFPTTDITDPANRDFDLKEFNQLLDALSRVQSYLALLQALFSPQGNNLQGRPVVGYTMWLNVEENVKLLQSIVTVILRKLYWQGNKLLRAMPKKYREAAPLEYFDANGRKTQDKIELPEEIFVKKYGFSKREPNFRNFEMLQYLISFIPKKVIKFFGGLSNSLVTRPKMGDPAQRAIAINTLEHMSGDLIVLLLFSDINKQGQTLDLHLYWLCCLNFIAQVLCGGTEQQAREYSKSLQTLFLNRFHGKGGLVAILSIIKSLTENFPPPPDKDATSADTERRLSIAANLKRAFHLIKLFTTESMINDSPQSAHLTNRDRHKESGHYFLMSAFLTDTRASCLPVLTNMLSLLNKLDKPVAQPLLSTLSDLILGGPEEFQTEHNKPDGEPSEDIIQRICLHGFDRAEAYAALMTHNNGENAALHYLHNRRANITNSPPVPNERPFPGDYSPGVTLSPMFFPTTGELPVPNFALQPETFGASADSHMEIDTPNPESASTMDKGKGKEVPESRIETLTRLRAEFSANLENYITDILVYHPDLPFELARLIKSVGKWEPAEFRQEKMLELAARLASLEDDKATKAKEIAACAHVLGLLLNEPRYYNSAESGIVEFLDSFVGFLTIEEGMETPWIASVAFIIEVVIREVEWRQCRKKYDPTHAPPEVAEIEPEFYERLLAKLIDVLKSDLTDETVIVCVLRLLVHLTREGKYSQIFRERNGIQALLQLNHKYAGKNTLKISESSIIIIRHVVEDDKIVLATMRSVIQNVLDMGANRGRHVDLNELLRNKFPEVLRNPELFGHAVEQLAKLFPGWTSSHPNNHKLTKKQPDAPTAANPETAKSDAEAESKESKPVPPETPKKSTLELNYSTGVVQTLLTELLNHHADTETAPKKDAAPVVGTNGSPPEGETNPVPNAPRTKLTPEECKEYAYTLFLLQAIAELVGSYNNCKLEFVNYSRRGQIRDPQTPSKPRSMMLNYLLNDLLPTGSVSSSSVPSQDMDFEKKRGISMLVANVVQSLCKKTPEFYEHDERPDLLVTVRKFVLEGIARSFKEILASVGPAQLRYSRYTSLADLCRKLLSTQSPYVPPTYAMDGFGTSEMAKLMFEKGFIGLLTSVVADIELDFPEVRVVVNDILASLKDLTTYVNRLATNSSIELGNTSGDVDEISTASSVSEEEEEMQDRDETPDVFRNSALGMLQGVVEDDGRNHHHHLHHHHLGFHEYHDEEMDYDEEDDEDDDDDDDLDVTGSEDEEMDEDGEDDMNVRAVEIIMGNGDDGDDDSEHSSDMSGDSDGMDDDEHDEADEEEHDEEDSIIDMLEEQQMEADQVDGADGWTTDSDSVEEGEEMDEEEDESDGEGFPHFHGLVHPPIPLPVFDPDADGLAYTEDDGDDAVEDFPDDVEGGLEQMFENMEDEEEEDDDNIDYGWIGEEHMRRHFRVGRGYLDRRLLADDYRGTPPRAYHLPEAPLATTSIHPMMINTQAPPPPRPVRGVTRHVSSTLAGAPPDLLRSMEQLFGMQNMLSDLMEQLGDGHQTTISFELRSGVPHAMPRILRRGQIPVQPQLAPDETAHPRKLVSDYMYAETSARWSQAALMWFQSVAPDRAATFEQHIFKLLEPAAIEEEKVRKAKEEADRKAAEAVKKEKEEIERHAAEEAEAKAKVEAERIEAENKAKEEARLAEEQAERERVAAEALIESSNAPGIVAMDEIETPDSAPAPAPVPAPAPSEQQVEESGPQPAIEATAEPTAPQSTSTERLFTTIRGSRVDITEMGVDPDFLEALPEEMREEVLTQHIREQARAAAPPGEPSTLDASFLEALPPDIRSELLEEEAAEQRRQARAANRQQNAPAGGNGPAVDIDFIASLEGPLRQAVLLDQDDDLLAQFPPHIVAEATALRERVGHRFGAPLFGHHRHVNPIEIRHRKAPAPKRKDGIQLLEKSGLATLIRLTFLRNRPEALQDILLELCRHRQTRIEVVGLLLSILQEGSADVAAVERSFSQLSLKVKGQDQAVSPLKSKTKMDSSFISHISGENSPTLIARHCLELLNHLIKNNHSLPFYFLTEHDSSVALKRVNSKKGKGKEVVTRESRYPINALLGLLDKSAILETKASTEEFARLLADVTKPLLSLQRKTPKKEQDKPKDTAAPPAPENEQPPPPADETAAAAPTTETDAQEPPPATTAEGTSEPGPSTSTAPKTEPAPPVRTLIPPVISTQNLELLVLILVAKEVSRETFRATLATMHNLMAVPGALEVFGRGLAREAQRYGDHAQSDLWAISKKFETAQAAETLKDVDLTEYTSRGADQTKLLKIFKAIDYLFNKIQKEDGGEKNKDEASRYGALAIYSQLSLGPLWENLSTCLSYLRDNPETYPLAQPLLPMIESLLVACNHINTSATGKRILDSPEAEKIEQLFFRFTEDHRKILNYLVHQQPSLMSGSFEMLAHNPKVLEFDNKRNYFNRKIHDRKGQRIPTRSISLNIRRDMVFLDSFRSLCFRTGEEVKNARLNVRFQGEEGVDAGGLTREWYQVLARQMFDPNYALFTPVASDSATFHPNKSSYVNDEHLMFFKFVGRIIGKALYDGRLLDCHFSRAVYKHILNRPISVKDLEYYDNQYYKNLMWILENPINDIVTETFSIEAEEYGVTHIIDLVPDGRTIPVTDENKSEYVRLVSEYRLQTSVKDQLKEFLTGFHDIIPADLVSIFTEQELELLISGLPDIDIEDWKAHSTYSNYEASSPQIQWFWRAVRSFDKEERAKLLQFATGTSKVPLNGFKDLEGMQGNTKFSIVRDFGHKNRLPQSHTCFNQIDLPEYESYEQLRSALLTAITMGTEGFGFA